MIPRITKQELPHRLHSSPNQHAVYAAQSIADIEQRVAWAIWIDWRNTL